jgi:hypothetical protein
MPHGHLHSLLHIRLFEQDFYVFHFSLLICSFSKLMNEKKAGDLIAESAVTASAATMRWWNLTVESLQSARLAV